MHGSVFLFLDVAQYQKQYLSLPEQRQLLETRGMQITDAPKAEECLQRVGYYRLSAYWYPFRKFNDDRSARLDEFSDDVNFWTVFDLYIFDKKLRLLFLDALERLEVALRTDVALLLGKYGAWGYRDPTNFDGTFARQIDKQSGLVPHLDWLTRFDDKAHMSKEEFAKHFRKKYRGDPFPIWIAVELLDFGPLSHLVAGMKTADQRALADRYAIPRPELLESWVRTLSFVRNVCAHHARLWNKPLKDYPKMPKSGEMPAFDHLIAVQDSVGRLYAAACMLRHFLQCINPSSSWAERLAAHLDTFPDNPHLTLRAAGFPEDWKTQALWK